VLYGHLNANRTARRLKGCSTGSTGGMYRWAEWTGGYGDIDKGTEKVAAGKHLTCAYAAPSCAYAVWAVPLIEYADAGGAI